MFMICVWLMSVWCLWMFLARIQGQKDRQGQKDKDRDRDILYHRMMSSYGWTLSVLYFLKDVRPGVISIPQWSAAYYGNKQNHHIKSDNSLNLIQLFKVWLNHNCGDFGVWNHFYHRYEQTSFRFETMICPCTGINVCQTITPSGRQKILETLAYYSTYFETIPPEIFYQASKVPSKEVSKVSFNWINLTQVLRIN